MTRRTLLALSLCLLSACAVLAGPASAAEWTPYDRPAEYATVTDRDVPITMRDGVVLRADVQRPDRPGRYPVVVVQTPYNKGGAINVALGGQNNYLVERGYVLVTVDVRGTGSSQGTWDSFGEAEQRDGYEIVEWAAAQPWSTGRVGLSGPSYMGLEQLLTAAQRPPHLKAIFPVVPMADGYRDIVLSGGSVNASFIPLWLGLVAAGSVVPPAYAASGDPNDLVGGTTTLLQHVAGTLAFDVPTLASATTGGDLAYDGPFWKTRSPIEVLDRIQVPAFVVGGHHDLFQRGEPLVYERLKRRVPARLLMGPWTHVAGSTGAGLPRDGVPSLDSIALRWFDHWLRGVDTRVEDIPKVTQYVYGDERYETQPDWPDPALQPRRMYLRGGSRLAADPPVLPEPPQGFVQHPMSGICTQSTSQWTAGLTEQLPCTTDDRLDEAAGAAVYTTDPLDRDLSLSGPILANVWLTTTARDAIVTVRVTDVDPSGRSTELTTGWQAASLRAVDASRSRIVKGQMLQPWHPFTRDSALPVPVGQPVEVPVEVFPARAVIKAGHRLRIAISPGDFPHQLPPVPRLLDSLGGYDQVLTDPAHPSYVALPALGDCARGCPPLPVPDLTRG